MDKKRAPRRNIYWPQDIDELAQSLVRQGRAKSISDLLRMLVIEEAENPRLEIIGGDKRTPEEIIQSILKKIEAAGKAKGVWGKYKNSDSASHDHTSI